MVERTRKTYLCCRLGSLSSPKNPTNLFVGVCQEASVKARVFRNHEKGILNTSGEVPKWLKGPVLKTDRSLIRCLGSNPSFSAI